MKMIVTPKIQVPKMDLFLLADIHAGAPDFMKEQFEKDIETIANNDHIYFLVLGDLWQRDLKDSPGDCMTQTMDIYEQEAYMEDKLGPIANKALAVIPGNHDNRGKDKDYPVRRFARHLDIPYGEAEMYLKICVGEKTYSLYGIHGYTNGRRISSVTNMLENLADICDADIYATAHAHKPVTFSKIFGRPDLYNKNVMSVERHFVGCRSYQGRGEYPQRIGLPGTPIGCSVVTLSGVRGEKQIYVAA